MPEAALRAQSMPSCATDIRSPTTVSSAISCPWNSSILVYTLTALEAAIRWPQGGLSWPLEWVGIYDPSAHSWDSRDPWEFLMLSDWASCWIVRWEIESRHSEISIKEWHWAVGCWEPPAPYMLNSEIPLSMLNWVKVPPLIPSSLPNIWNQKGV